MPENMKGPRHLPPLVALRAFEAVGSTGSVRAAAAALSVSPTVISRHLDNLEARLGVELVARKGRSIVLTEAGARFHATVAQAFDQIGAATEKLTKISRVPLRLSCWPGLAVMRLLPRLPELEARLPGYAIHFHPTLARADLKRGDADAEIYYRAGDAPVPTGLVEFELARPRVMPVASLALVKRQALPAEDVEVLFGLPWSHELSSDEWRDWLSKAGLAIDARAEARLEGARLWHAHVAIGAAQLGQGVALANELLVGADLAEGRLIEIGHTDVRLGAYVLAMRAGAEDSEPMQALTAWLREATTLQTPATARKATKRKQSTAN